MAVKPASIDKQLADQGKGIYEQKCSSCHGSRGLGSASFARIAGQQPVYVVKTLKQFRENANANAETASSKRSSNIMEAIVKQSSDSELEIIAAYIAQLK